MARTRDVRDDMGRRGIPSGTFSLGEAAAFVGVSPNTFLNEVEAGTLPRPLPLKSKRRLWSRSALARAIGSEDTASEGDVSEEIDKAIDEYAV